ncbi:type III PLP-dependent enzyme [Pectinatus cerevisiiphilus]|uniref:ornithine decarboxylase n=1 Tax=Pectinatus cerevisiiphilus TaxID=86956 RepID=A0A4R3K231_9FIRM|nr:type III PLP-dependent enzyme [Pectinatus cerevisiiphilus]TCS76155.1 ornithine decarboxylase [Pectinatus cerevisiiphilus]
MKSFKLTKEQAEILVNKYPTPLAVISTDQVEKNYQFLLNNMPRVRVFYAIKANPSPIIIEKMMEMGSSFDVASDGEIRMLYSMGVSGENMIYANPIKTIQGLRAAAETGVNKFTFDNEKEIYRMAEYVPGAKVLLRIRIKNAKALVNLNEKFGAEPEKAISLLKLAKEQGLNPVGLAFHVGSQTLSTEPYYEAFSLCRGIIDEAGQAGLNLNILDIGGGLPVPAPDTCVNLENMVKTINAGLDKFFPDVEIWAEPGRYICGTVMNAITRVIGKQLRDDRMCYYLDEGVYGIFSGVFFDHWEYELNSFKQGKLLPSTFFGPSCDSLDVVAKDYPCPDLQLDDIVVASDCGAYTIASSTNFNGFAKARVLHWEKEKESLMIVQEQKANCEAVV